MARKMPAAQTDGLDAFVKKAMRVFYGRVSQHVFWWMQSPSSAYAYCHIKTIRRPDKVAEPKW